MHPAFSVIFLTTLIGAAQGLFLALFSGQAYTELNLLPSMANTNFFGLGAVMVLVLLVGGLISSFFHLGHPERAWRSAAMWRTSWLSREVIALPLMMGVTFVYAVMQLGGHDAVVYSSATNHFTYSLLVGSIGVVAAFALFICTAMIYACIKFLQEWSSPLTVINYILLGTASGFTLATAFSSYYVAPEMTKFYGVWAIILTVAAFLTRSASLIRNSRIKFKSTVQSAIGVRHNVIQQKSQGAMGGSFNTREYFHGKTAFFLKSVKWVFMMLVFPLPILLISSAMTTHSAEVYVVAFLVQYVGLLAERWFFFAQANHPQNIYYQTV
ncbi:MAG: dimethyl sulfoxide reductase anchor subunit [Gammaproteobacteria bacterium]|nr:dimethyl sulfoxide reductase anchor subunit [Gammaproteobacteria bacterium]